MYEDASVPASSFSTSICGNTLFCIILGREKELSIRVISLDHWVSDLVSKVICFQIVTEKTQIIFLFQGFVVEKVKLQDRKLRTNKVFLSWSLSKL